MARTLLTLEPLYGDYLNLCHISASQTAYNTEQGAAYQQMHDLKPSEAPRRDTPLGFRCSLAYGKR